ncbi:MAG: energy-coupling factor transporter ATPase [Clostridiaceae bacterium]|nr:energy-coupling factor transporter ATPase [Clostridiaceae bacterium]
MTSQAAQLKYEPGQTIIEIEGLSFSYEPDQPEAPNALNGVDLEVKAGTHLAILGRNGSGKSTLARLIDALELPLSGRIRVDGIEAVDDETSYMVRRRCGLVFQNPDNQIIGTTVEEDVAFGPENLGIPNPELRDRVDTALAIVGLSEYAQRPPAQLSGGMKQKLAIAGIMAMQPRVLILDEATSMLDPFSRRDFMELVQKLNREEKLTVLNITHNMEEAMAADFVVVMHEGKILLRGRPEQIFAHAAEIIDAGLDVPAHAAIAHLLSKELNLPICPEEAASFTGAINTVTRLMCTAAEREDTANGPASPADPIVSGSAVFAGEIIVEVEDLSYTYNPNTPGATEALHEVNLQVRRGEVLGIMGHSGSGKSTLVQHLNGLIRPQTGSVRVLGFNTRLNKEIRELRRMVGLVFQYPEHQLFADSVFADIAYGPKRLGLSEAEVERRVYAAAEIVGFDPDILQRSPFELSGGQKRRAAMAGVIAMEPEVLILDEPAAGLDPAGREEILGYVRELAHKGRTIILVSHNMEDLARFADRLLVMKDGRSLFLGTTDEVFSRVDILAAAGLEKPRTAQFMEALAEEHPDWPIGTNAYSVEAAVRMIRQAGVPKPAERRSAVTKPQVER